jgi:V/A-type H+-transporting ATPase subunit F
MSLYVIGDENTLLGFSLIGVDGQVVGSVEEARASLQRVLDDESVDMVLITEN